MKKQGSTPVSVTRQRTLSRFRKSSSMEDAVFRQARSHKQLFMSATDLALKGRLGSEHGEAQQLEGRKISSGRVVGGHVVRFLCHQGSVAKSPKYHSARFPGTQIHMAFSFDF